MWATNVSLVFSDEFTSWTKYKIPPVELGPTMKLWDKVFTCYLLLDHVLSNPLLRSLQSLPAGQLHYDSEKRLDTSSASESGRMTDNRQQQLPFKDDMVTQSPQQLEDVLDFIKSTISRLRRSDEQGTDLALTEMRTRRALPGGRRGQSRGSWASGQGGGGRRRGKGNSGQAHGCKLRQIQLNVSDLGLGYQTREEMIFRYCSGPCTNSETNYDKILNNLTQNRKLLRDSPPHACCRPTAFDDDLSFLDDNLIYHTMKKHSARKCGCV